MTDTTNPDIYLRPFHHMKTDKELVLPDISPTPELFEYWSKCEDTRIFTRAELIFMYRVTNGHIYPLIYNLLQHGVTSVGGTNLILVGFIPNYNLGAGHDCLSFRRFVAKHGMMSDPPAEFSYAYENLRRFMDSWHGGVAVTM